MLLSPIQLFHIPNESGREHNISSVDPYLTKCFAVFWRSRWVLLAFFEVLWMCESQRSLSSISTPRYLIQFVWVICVQVHWGRLFWHSCNLSVCSFLGWPLLFIENVIYLVLLTFSVREFAFSQFCSTARPSSASL